MKYIKLTIIALALTTTMSAQTDFFGKFSPKAKNEKVINLPDKPNKTDGQGRKQGEWAKKYDNGQYTYTARFVDGIPVDTVRRYYENGVISTEQIYKSADSCFVISYGEDGKKEASGLYIKNQREGEWLTFDKSGDITSRETYKGGQLNGKAYIYFAGGEVYDERNYTNGTLNGAWTQNFRGGGRQLEATYKNGQLNGRYRHWDIDGNLSVDGNYRNGIKTGDWRMYDSETKSHFTMKYDKDGNLTNSDEIEKNMSKKIDAAEKNSHLLTDPEMYVNSPEDYRP
ncbi:MAG: hypothetical protein J6Y82_08835 [Bacteroidales bacterium]|nr:hypothetical protein [Bacteroidales bacterium]